MPLAHAEAGPARGDDISLIRSQPLCVINARSSAGELGSSVVTRHRRERDLLWVSYFVYWSSERPWGHKHWLPSLAIDAVYSHFLFVLPGLRRVLYGPGDVEGVTIVYRDVGGRLEILEGYADDEYHRPVHLGPEDLTGGDGQTLLLTDTWSHQLGYRGAARRAGAEVSRRCFKGAELVPLTQDIAESFWLGSQGAPRRARKAWL